MSVFNMLASRFTDRLVDQLRERVDESVDQAKKSTIVFLVAALLTLLSTFSLLMSLFFALASLPRFAWAALGCAAVAAIGGFCASKYGNDLIHKIPDPLKIRAPINGHAARKN